MPIVIVWGLGALGVGAGLKLAGDGIEDGTRAARDLAIVGGIGMAAYLIAKKQGLI